MKKSRKVKTAINNQITVLFIGIFLTAFIIPVLIKGNYYDLFRTHAGKLRNTPIIGFIIVGLVLVIASSINLIKIHRKNKRS